MTVGSEIRIFVKGIKGPQCEEALTHAIQKLDPSAFVQVEPKQGYIDVVTTQPEQAVFMAIKDLGYHPHH